MSLLGQNKRDVDCGLLIWNLGLNMEWGRYWVDGEGWKDESGSGFELFFAMLVCPEDKKQ